MRRYARVGTGLRTGRFGNKHIPALNVWMLSKVSRRGWWALRSPCLLHELSLNIGVPQRSGGGQSIVTDAFDFDRKFEGNGTEIVPPMLCRPWCILLAPGTFTTFGRSPATEADWLF